MRRSAVNVNKQGRFCNSKVTSAYVAKPYQMFLGNRCSIRLSYGTTSAFAEAAFIAAPLMAFKRRRFGGSQKNPPHMAGECPA
jgi:hypothetical protein